MRRLKNTPAFLTTFCEGVEFRISWKSDKWFIRQY